MASFPLRPVSRFQQSGPNTTIKRPQEFTFYSLDENRDFHYRSEKSLRYYFPPFFAAPGSPAPHVDLSTGFEDWIEGDSSIDHHLDGLLEALQKYEEGLMAEGVKPEDAKTDADVVTWRGMMTKILVSAFDHFSDFEMNATCYQGTIYIEENHAYSQPPDPPPPRPTPPNSIPQKQMQFWGHKFESLSVLRQLWANSTRASIETRDRHRVNSNEQYCSLVRTGIGSTSLILAGEVDCVLGGKPADAATQPTPWVELKTAAEHVSDHPRERLKWERKLLRFWAQSFLLGVPRIAVGFRTPRGLLTRVEELETRRLPGVVARGQRAWDGNACVKVAEGFLGFLRERVGGREGVWRIKRAERGGEVRVWRVEERGTAGVLSEGFKAHRERMAAAMAAGKGEGGDDQS